MLDQETRNRIIAEETARFMDGAFGQLDLSGSPDLNHPPEETFELQDRHGFNRVDDHSVLPFVMSCAASAVHVCERADNTPESENAHALR